MQQVGQLFGIDPHSHQFVGRNEDVDYFRLYAEQRYFHHAVCCDNLRLDPFRPVAHFLIGEAVICRQSIINAEYVAEIIGDGRGGSTAGQLRLNIEHFASQLVPFLRDGTGGK